MDKLEEVLSKFSLKLGEDDRKTFRDAYGVANKDDVLVNVEKLINFEKTQHIGKIYD